MEIQYMDLFIVAMENVGDIFKKEVSGVKLEIQKMEFGHVNLLMIVVMNVTMHD